MAGQDWDPFADPADTGAEITKCVVEDFQPGGRAKLTWHVDTGGKLAGHRIKNSLDLFSSTRSSGVRVLSKLSWMVVPMWLDMWDVWQGLLKERMHPWWYTSSTGERCQVHLQHKARFWHGPGLTNAVPFAARWADKARGYIFWPEMGGIWWYNPARLGGYHCFFKNKR